jgi:hypothetical protein
MEWSLQERYIPKSASKRRDSVVLGPAAALRQENDRKVRPGRLPQQKRRQRLQVGATDRLISDDREARTFIEFFTDCWEIRSRFGCEARFLQD